jgi:CHRD domain
VLADVGFSDLPRAFPSYTNQQEAVMRAHLLGGLTIVALLALGSCKDDVGITVSERFAATLSGASSRPTPITTTASGTASFTYVADIKTLFYRIDVASIDSVFLAHIHGPADTGQTAGVVLNLFVPAAPKGLAFSGTLAQGVGGDLGAPAGMTLDSLLVLMRNGHAYVNVHTRAHPAGEIRGQVVTQ